MEFLTCEGGFGGKYSDNAILRELNGRFNPRNHANNGEGVDRTEVFDAGDGGGVTSDHDDLRTLANEVVNQQGDALLDLLVGLRSIGAPSGVRNVMERILREDAVDLV